MGFARHTIGALLVLVVPIASYADWPNLNPTTWVQYPDEGTTGLDVKATAPKLLADDFLSKVSGPIARTSATPSVVGAWIFERATRECRISPTKTTLSPLIFPLISRSVNISKSPCVGCSLMPSPAFTIPHLV